MINDSLHVLAICTFHTKEVGAYLTFVSEVCKAMCAIKPVCMNSYFNVFLDNGETHFSQEEKIKQKANMEMMYHNLITMFLRHKITHLSAPDLSE